MNEQRAKILEAQIRRQLNELEAEIHRRVTEFFDDYTEEDYLPFSLPDEVHAVIRKAFGDDDDPDRP